MDGWTGWKCGRGTDFGCIPDTDRAILGSGVDEIRPTPPEGLHGARVSGQLSHALSVLDIPDPDRAVLAPARDPPEQVHTQILLSRLFSSLVLHS